MRTPKLVLISVLLFMFAQTSVAGFNIYHDRSGWAASAGETTSENFDSIVEDTDFHPGALIFLGSGLSLQALGEDGQNFIDVAPISSEVDVDGTAVANIFNGQSGNALLPSFRFSSPISAFGADFRSLQDFEVRTRFELRLDGQFVDTIEPNVASGGELRFFGFTANGGEIFNEIVVLRVNNDVFGMDYVEWGEAQPLLPVPTLGPIGMIVLLFGVLLVSSRRFRLNVSR